MDEIWQPINYFYDVSSLGNVCSKRKQLKPFPNSKGYLYVNFTTKGKRKTISVHRLVATAFISNPLNLPQVNHKDGVKSNNQYTNLEWATNGENTQHAYDMGLNNGNGKPVLQFSKSGEQLNEFRSVRDAGIQCNISHTSIWKCCVNKRRTSGGFIWKYK